MNYSHPFERSPMNIVVCVKQVPDTKLSIEVDPDTNSIESEGWAYMVNPYDKLALEEAVRIKERDGKGQVVAVSMGTPSARKALRSCLTQGADRAILLCDRAFENSDCYATAVVLAKAISSLEYDLILCGVRAMDDNAGQVGPFIAEMLGIPSVTAVTDIEIPQDNSKVVIQRKIEKGNREVMETQLPTLLTIEAGHEPRYQSLPSFIAGLRREIEILDNKALGLSAQEVGAKGSRTQVIRVSPPRPRPKKIFTPDSSLPAAERMRLILTGGIAEKKGDLLEGPPEDIASKLVSYLKQQKLLPE